MLTISREAFESFVREGVEAIPEKFRSRIRNVAFLVRARPTPEQRQQNHLARGDTLLGLYEGVPRTARGEAYGPFALPDRITIFKGPIEEEARFLLEERLGDFKHTFLAAQSEEAERLLRDEARRLVIDTVWHEVAHHFGLDEERVGKREKEGRVRR
jgi:predicted Zn-dependent protease with MMP-like domain